MNVIRNAAKSRRLSLIALGALAVAVVTAALGATVAGTDTTRLRFTLVAIGLVALAAMLALLSVVTVLQGLHRLVANGAKAQQGEANTVRKDLAGLQREISAAERRLGVRVEANYAQTEALLGLDAELHQGRHSLPPLRRWAVSPDLALHLVRHVRQHRPELVVETGSGSSTVLIALALERIGAGHVVALEHDATYLAATNALLEEHGVAHRATVHHCPLVEQTVDGRTAPWYDVSAVALGGTIDLLLVDGPPEATGPEARFPVLALLRDHLRNGTTMVLDDADRPDETSIIAKWQAAGLVTGVQRLPFEKGAAQMTLAYGGSD
jgi:predicted O-methyltransferase YrrM